jgi:hypothetical protein
MAACGSAVREGVPLPKKGKGKAKSATAAEDKPSEAGDSHAYVAAAVSESTLRALGSQSLRLLDTGALQHYDRNLANFVDIRPCEPYQIQTASGIEFTTRFRLRPESNSPRRSVRSSSPATDLLLRVGHTW